MLVNVSRGIIKAVQILSSLKNNRSRMGFQLVPLTVGKEEKGSCKDVYLHSYIKVHLKH